MKRVGASRDGVGRGVSRSGPVHLLTVTMSARQAVGFPTAVPHLLERAEEFFPGRESAPTRAIEQGRVDEIVKQHR